MPDNTFSSLFIDMNPEASRTVVTSRRFARIPPYIFVLGTFFFELVTLGVISLAMAIQFVRLNYGLWTDYSLVSLGLVCAVVILFKNNHLYKIEMIADFKHALPRILKIWTFVFLALVTLGMLAKMSDQYSRLWLISIYTLGAMTLIVERKMVAGLFRLSVKSGRTSHSVVLVGDCALAAGFMKRIEGNPYGVVVTAIFDEALEAGSATPENIPVWGKSGDLLRYHRDHAIDTVVVTLPMHDTERLKKTVWQLTMQPLNIRILPGELALRQPRKWYAPYGEMPGTQLMAISDRPIAIWGFIVKNILDRLMALLALLVFSPILLACVIGIKLNSPGPVLFRQRRIGYRNRTFEVYKFRSMHVNACNTGKLTERNDPRIFKFGQLMRKLSFDELPQIFNVLRGDMSLVGPRPHMPEAQAAGQYYFDAVAEYASRHRVKPGITGWAQVSGWRGPTETLEQIEKRVSHDLYYIDNWSLGLDIVILFKTIWSGFAGKNAF